MLAFELLEVFSGRSSFPEKLNKASVLVALNRWDASLDQQIRSARCLQWSAEMIAEVYDLVLKRRFG